MKKYILFLLLIFLGTYTYSQNFKKNNCSENLTIVFLNQDDAKFQLKDHKNAKGYLNIIISKSGVLYKDDYIKNMEDLSSQLKLDSDLPKAFRVSIGIENLSKFELFSDLICWLDRLPTNEVGEVAVYHFD